MSAFKNNLPEFVFCVVILLIAYALGEVLKQENCESQSSVYRPVA